MGVKYTNNARTTLNGSVTNVATSIVVTDGSVFPAAGGADYFYMTLENAASTTREIVKVTARSTNTLTVVRGQDGTSATAFANADKAELRLTTALLTDALAEKQDVDADLASWAAITRAAGFDAFVATPSSANLRTLITDESGSGALLFAGGALGTPASGVLTNCTGLPNASVVGLGTSATVNTGTSGATIPLLNGANTFSAVQTFQGASGASAIRVNGAGGSWFWIDNPSTTLLRFSSGATPGTGALTLSDAGALAVSGVLAANYSAANYGLTVTNTGNTELVALYGGAGYNVISFFASGVRKSYMGLNGAAVNIVNEHSAGALNLITTGGGVVQANSNNIWHAGNDGAGSGLDADLWDGNNFASYLNQAVLTTSSPTFAALTVNTDTTYRFGSGSDTPAMSGTSPLLYVNGLYATGIAAKRTGSYAEVGMQSGSRAYLGSYNGFDVDFVRNNVAILEMTASNLIHLATSGTYWHSGNDGSGSGLDADLLDGLNAVEAGTPSTIPRRSPNGQINAGGTGLAGSSAAFIAGGPYGGGFSMNDGGYAGMYTDNAGANLRLYSASGSTITFNGNAVWHAGNDGAGSGLDADLLDGYNVGTSGGTIPLLDGTNTWSAAQTLSGSGTRLTMSGNSGNYVGGALTSTNLSITWLYVVDSVGGFTLNKGGSDLFHIGRSGGTTAAFAGAITSGGNTVWHAGNDGAGSGLDADLLDGKNGANYVQQNSAGDWPNYFYPGGDYYTSVHGGSNNFNSFIAQGSYHVDSSAANQPIAHYGYLRNWRHNGANYLQQEFTSSASGTTYTRIGYDNSGSIAFQGWRTVWDSNNDGAGSGLDADLLDGYSSSSSATANTIALRDASGDLTARYFWGNYINLSMGFEPAIPDRVYQSYDGYVRMATVAVHKTDMGLSGRNTHSRRSQTADTNYHVGSFGWANSYGGANEMFHGGSGFWDIWDNATNQPAGWGHTHGINVSHYSASAFGSTGGAAYGFQIAGAYHSNGNLYTRAVNNGTFGAWQLIWSAGNDGAGSGLDADLLDGYSSASFVLQNNVFNTTYIGFTHVGGNSGVGNADYALYQEAGAWTHPYPDLIFAYHTGIKIMSTTGYGGTKFYGLTPSYVGSTDPLFIVGNIDNATSHISHAVTSTTTDGFGLEFLINGAYVDGRYAHRLAKYDSGGGVPLYVQKTSGTAGSWTTIARFGSFSGNANEFEVFGPAQVSGNLTLGNQLILSGGGQVWDQSTTRTIISANGNQFDVLTENNATYIGSFSASVFQRQGLYTVWDAGNDGSGSTLDADTVDGVHASQIVYGGSTGKSLGDQSNMNSNTLRSGFYYYNNPSNGPIADWQNWIHVRGDGWGDGNQYGFQISSAFHSNNLYYRRHANAGYDSWFNIWHSGSDGSGSGLDADLLDGIDSTGFLRGTQNAWIADSSGQNRFYFTGSSHTYISAPSSSSLIFQNSSGTNAWIVDSSGNMTASGNVTAYSDITLKEDLRRITNALEKVGTLTGYTYTRTDTKNRQTGLVAQDVEKILPEAVMTNEKGIKSLAYGNLMGLMVEAIKELRAEVAELKRAV